MGLVDKAGWKVGGGYIRKINSIDEITNVKFNQLDVEQFTREELDEILAFLCTS